MMTQNKWAWAWAYINQALLYSSSHYKHSCFRYSCLGDLSLLPLMLSAFPSLALCAHL